MRHDIRLAVGLEHIQRRHQGIREGPVGRVADLNTRSQSLSMSARPAASWETPFHTQVQQVATLHHDDAGIQHTCRRGKSRLRMTAAIWSARPAGRDREKVALIVGILALGASAWT